MKQKPFRICLEARAPHTLNSTVVDIRNGNKNRNRETTVGTNEGPIKKKERKRKKKTVDTVNWSSWPCHALLPLPLRNCRKIHSPGHNLDDTCMPGMLGIHNLRERNYLLFFRVYNKLIIPRRCCFGAAHWWRGAYHYTIIVTELSPNV